MAWLERVGWSGGTNVPVSRNDRTLDIRSNEEADGESRMMGSERFEETALGVSALRGAGAVRLGRSAYDLLACCCPGLGAAIWD